MGLLVLLGLVVALGLFLGLSNPSYDPTGCSAWWKVKIVRQKLSGDLHYIGWREVAHAVIEPCYDHLKPHPYDRVTKLAERDQDGRTLVQYRTPLGDFWVPGPERALLAFIVWEIHDQHDYEGRGVAVKPGDIVIDCGAHVGIFCRYALRRGAARVIAVEPDPVNRACLRENLSAEIAAGQVDVVEAGVWSTRSTMPLFQAPVNSGGSSFVNQQPPNTTRIENVPLLPLDEVVADLKLPRVDFIKMDIEGAERYALQGGAATIRHYHPRMAICTYHSAEDVTLLPTIVKKADPTYKVRAKDLYIMDGRVNTKVLFFY
jgi:FkbM family methyltransferase